MESCICHQPQAVQTMSDVLQPVQLPCTFQTMMNDILQDFISHRELICYMDDILIPSEDLTKHCQVT